VRDQAKAQNVPVIAYDGLIQNAPIDYYVSFQNEQVGKDRGVPLALIIFAGLVVIIDIVTTRTRYGQNVFAVGGNIEAARRAGINVQAIRASVFILAAAFAAFGGVLAASRLFAVSQSSGSGDVLLNAIAAVVIGGTSLFGGRGTAYSALLGTLVIGAISNGMDLLGLNSSVKLMITGGVLVTAVTLDTVARRGRAA
jgi:D-xylose transport system permease protein